VTRRERMNTAVDMFAPCRPIILQGWGVRASLEDRKTMTRRVILPQPVFLQALRDGRFETSPDGGFDQGVKYIRCPYGVPGDLLWVRESWAPNEVLPLRDRPDGAYIYRADERYSCHWHPSIHMPRKASRLTLRITDIRVQRLQEITDGDVAAEGVGWSSTRIGNDHGSPARDAFVSLWDTINAHPKPAGHNPYTGAREACYISFPWEAARETRERRGKPWYVVGNPWVWVIGYERVTKERAAVDGHNKPASPGGAHEGVAEAG